MRDLSTTALAALALALSVPASAQDSPKARPPATGLEQGFFRPAPDPALTSVRPAPATASNQTDARAAAPAFPQIVVDPAEEIRKAEEETMDRSEREHDRARAEAAMTATAPAQAVSAGSPPQ